MPLHIKGRDDMIGRPADSPGLHEQRGHQQFVHHRQGPKEPLGLGVAGEFQHADTDLPPGAEPYAADRAIAGLQGG